MNTFARVSDLPVTIETCDLTGISRRATPGFERHTTVVRLNGRGATGRGEDVTYDTQDQQAFQRTGPPGSLVGEHTLAGFGRALDGLDLFPVKSPSQVAYRHYRRWAFESAALDLALAQAGTSLPDVVGITPRPLRFVSSTGLGDPPSATPLRAWLAVYPDLRFKLDAGTGWTDALCDELAGLGVVDVIDLKGAYHGTPVDLAPDPRLYARIVRAFPDAWIEDPALNPQTSPVLSGHHDRITWDAPIHSVDDILALPFAPRTLNLKPSRFGSLEALFAAYDHCREQGIHMYGGGQWELGPGRGQIQLLAALFHPEAPNDVAPGGYNARDVARGLPTSPLAPRAAPRGFRRLEDP